MAACLSIAFITITVNRVIIFIFPKKRSGDKHPLKIGMPTFNFSGESVISDRDQEVQLLTLPCVW